MSDCPCRFCTVDDGRNPDCHGYCKRYKTWKIKHDTQVAEERKQRQARWTPRTGQWYRQPDGHWRNKKVVKERK